MEVTDTESTQNTPFREQLQASEMATPRVKRLKAKVVSKACHNGGYFGDVKPDLERAVLWTDSYKQTEGQPEILRRAKALENALLNGTIYIQDEELIVGYSPINYFHISNNTPSPSLLYLSPEINPELINEAIEDGFFKSEEEKKTALSLSDYWKGKCMKDWVEARMTDEEKIVTKAGAPVISITHLDGAQHCVPNWYYVYENGFKKIINNIENAKKDHPDREAFHEALLITLNAMIKWAKRYAKLAREQKSTATEERKLELENIANICDKLFIEPPQTFQEALQVFFLIHLALQYIDRAGFGSLARIDQIWYPFYKADIEAGRLTKEKAIELLSCLWIKMLDLGYWFNRVRRTHFEGNSLLQTLTVAGIKKDGTDACNELTEVILESIRITRNNQPTFNFRYSPTVNDKALTQAIECIKTGMGMPAFLNDDVMIKILMDEGIPLEEARNWGVVGCVSGCPTSSQVTTKRLAQSNITAKCLELALNDGVCVLTGKQLGLNTGDASKFTFEDLKEAYRKQVQYSFEMGIHIRNISREYEAQYLNRPLASALHVSPIQVGKDVSSYEDYPNLWINCVGMVDVADSLYAIQKLCFEDKQYTMQAYSYHEFTLHSLTLHQDFVHAMRTNWIDNEVFRQRCINKVDKFGNDLASVDEVAKWVFEATALEARKVPDILNGGTYRILPQSVSLYIGTGKKVAALPNGRKAFDFLADGGASPQHGLDTHGPSAVMNSVSKLCHPLTKGIFIFCLTSYFLLGILLNQRWMPEALSGEDGMKRFKAFLRTFFDLGLSQIQFNVVSNVDLINAQKHPEEYQDLIVRVAGYSAFFTQLSKDVQDAIIARRAQVWN